MIAVARATGQPAFIPLAFMVLAWVRMLRGELADCAAALDAAIEESRLLRNDQSLAGLNLMRSLTAPGGRRPRARRQHGAGGGRPDPEHG